MNISSSHWSDKKVCVTGGTGFLGSHLVQQLRARGARVTILSLPPRADHPLSAFPDVIKIYGDIRDAAVVASAVADCDVVFHTAGNVAVWGPGLAAMHAIHVEGTRNVLDAAGSRAVIVHTSSIVAVGTGRRHEIFDETSPFNLSKTRLDYVHAKRAAEELALTRAAAGQHVVVVNPGYLIGPEDTEHSVMSRLFRRYWRGRAPCSLPGGLNVVDVRDAALGHLLAAERGRPGRRYILGGTNCTYPEFFSALAAAAGFRPRAQIRLPWLGVAIFALLAEGRALLTRREPLLGFGHVRLHRYCWFVNSERARRELGYETRPLTETLRDTHQWYADQGKVWIRGLARWWMRPAPRVA